MRNHCLLCGAFVTVLLWSYDSVGGDGGQASVTPSTRLDENADQTPLDSLIRSSQYPELAAEVAHMEPSEDREYFAGILRSRQGRIKESAELLSSIIPSLRMKHAKRAAVALHTLAEDYVRMYRYSDASRTYEDLLHNFSSQLPADELQSTKDDAGAIGLMQTAGPQTISFDGPADIPVHQEPGLGTFDADITAGNVTASWILDTGANFSTVAASFAQRLQLPLSAAEAQTQGITGAENKLRVAVLPELRLGTAIVRNVILLVLDDKNLDVQTGTHTHHQINAILGYPVLQALGRFTFTSNNRLLAGPDSPSGEGGAPMFLEGLTPLLECRVENQNVLFSFDTGATGTMYSAHYAKEFPAQLQKGKKQTELMGGAGGAKKATVIVLPHPQLQIGDTTVTLQNVPVMPPIGTDIDKFSGNLGRDVVTPYSSFTLDFTAMRFRLGKKL